MPFELSQLNAHQIDTLPKLKTVFFFPVGPLEDHGPHLPVGLDLQEAELLCHLSAERLESEMPGWVGVIMPRLALGVESNTTRMALTVRSYILRDCLVDLCKGLVDLGFVHFACFSGHLGPKQLTAIEDAGVFLRRQNRWNRMKSRVVFTRSTPKPTLISVSSALVGIKDFKSAPLWPDPLEHGGKRDTSVALLVSKNLVDSSYLGLPTLHRNPSLWVRFWSRKTKKISSYWGTPSQALPADGEKEILTSLDRVFPKMRVIWEQEGSPKFLFKSWYSILPPNKTLFKIYLLTLLIFIFGMAWIYLQTLQLEIT
jgi:creatinine amidohydrolase/Fe(II)-dependent formamide hydrolase-like protein